MINNSFFLNSDVVTKALIQDLIIFFFITISFCYIILILS